MSRARIDATRVENQVATWLRNQGWTILKRRYKSGRGEIDIIALDGEVLVFVEVKSTQRDAEYARTALTPDKLQRMQEAAGSYIYENHLAEPSVRFDLVVVSPGGCTLYGDLLNEG